MTAEDPEELLNAGAYGAGAVIRLQWSATQAGVFADVSGTGSTPTLALVAGTYNYPAYDPVGTSTTFYRTRFENVGATRLSDWSPVFQVGSGGYTSLFNVKQDLDKAPTDAVADELLLDYIAEITDYIRGNTGREFGTDPNVIYTFDGAAAANGHRTLLVPWGVQSISLYEVAYNTGGSFLTNPSTDLFLRPQVQDRTPGWPATEVWLSDVPTGAYSRFPYGFGNVRLTGVFGFASVPARIEGVARRAVVRAYAARQAGSNDMTGSGGGGGDPIVSQFLSKRDREVLDAFRRFALA